MQYCGGSIATLSPAEASASSTPSHPAASDSVEPAAACWPAGLAVTKKKVR